MTRNSTTRSSRRRWTAAIFIIAGALVGIPAVAAGNNMFSQAVGRVTVVTDADGRERTVYWHDYPGIADVDPQKILQGPTPEEGLAAGQDMIAEVRAALTAQLQLEWAPTPDGQEVFDPFVHQIQNYFGGESLLTAMNALPSQSTSVPRAWADKQRTLAIIGTVIARHGYSAPVIDTFDQWTDEQRTSDLGGKTPETQVIVSGMAQGPAGQWLSFTFQDLAKDATGRLEERLTRPTESGWQLDTLRLSYGANGLLPDAYREEFKERLEPFAGQTPPAPLAT
ncbi:hypothetical protein J2X01_001572 [Arthrobacter ginsengisoli]|uniref:Uncharacterized protein n=1 Tax=Arthrobacter ginsengisoli TaxID=1356565 RepID=A0ABU1UAR4_9MICC|nr:hypothetical protein [Arthrobacter ginsengisoli]MDR7082284.1 hypothetical protein [Arthrobacter ginsengisoli]